MDYIDETIVVKACDDINLDGQFVGVCQDTGDHLRISGWMAENVEILPDVTGELSMKI
jgi:hypothetical protein